MRILKFSTQLLAALVYTPLYTGIMYMAILLPFSWIMSLPFWKMIVAFVVLGGLIEGLIAFLQMVGLMPFAWIVKRNKAALWVSTGLCVIFPILNIVSLWRMFLGHGTVGVVAAVILSIMFIQFVCGSVLSLCGLKSNE